MGDLISAAFSGVTVKNQTWKKGKRKGQTGWGLEGGGGIQSQENPSSLEEVGPSGREGPL